MVPALILLPQRPSRSRAGAAPHSDSARSSPTAREIPARRSRTRATGIVRFLVDPPAAGPRPDTRRA